MSAGRVVAQILITLVVVGLIMPVVLVFMPMAQDPKVGPSAAAALAVIVFVLLRLGWPRPKPRL